MTPRLYPQSSYTRHSSASGADWQNCSIGSAASVVPTYSPAAAASTEVVSCGGVDGVLKPSVLASVQRGLRCATQSVREVAKSLFTAMEQ